MASKRELARRQAAKRIMRAFADLQGFSLRDMREDRLPDRVNFTATAPDGREFGVGYMRETGA